MDLKVNDVSCVTQTQEVNQTKPTDDGFKFTLASAIDDAELKEKLLFWKRNRYENRVVLDHISFEVKKGEAIGLVGKNGCGKSTTLKMLTRIIYPKSGPSNCQRTNMAFLCRFY